MIQDSNAECYIEFLNKTKKVYTCFMRIVQYCNVQAFLLATYIFFIQTFLLYTYIDERCETRFKNGDMVHFSIRCYLLY